MSDRRIPNWFLILSSIGACFCFMWPRLLDAHFGLLDDGVILVWAREIAERPVIALTIATEHGRFMPGFWLFNAAVYGVVGQNPAGFFAANLLILIGLTVTLAFAVRAAGGTDLQAMLAAACFLIGGPVVEAFYTLSKPEPLQTLLLATAIYLAMRGAHARTQAGRWLSTAGVVVLLLAASSLKETTLIVLPIIVAWALASWLTGTWVATERRRSLVVLLLAGGAAVTAFMATRALFLTTAQLSNAYASNFVVTPERIGDSAARWAGWLLHDYAHLFVLAVFVAPSIREASRPERELLVASTVWMGAWVAMYLPWNSLFRYYLLPFNLGAAVFTAVALSVLIGRTREALRPRHRWLARLGLVITAGVLVANIVNNMTQAAIQLILDRSNAYLIDHLASLPSGTTVFVNLDEPNEYEFEIGLHLAELRGRGDMHVDYLSPQGLSTPDRNVTRVIATPIVANQIAPSVRVPVWEGRIVQRQQLLEGIESQRGGWSIQSSAHLVDVGFHRLLTAVPYGPNARIDTGMERRFVERRRFTYGWRVVAVGP